MRAPTPRLAALLAAAAVVVAGILTNGASAAAPVAASAPHHPVYLPPIVPPPVALPVGVPIVAAGQPTPVNMAYFGGPVLVRPKIYLIFWQWASPSDPAAQRLVGFFRGVGGSRWEGVATQYTMTVGGKRVAVTNPAGQLAGVWFDNATPIHDNLADIEIAREAARGVRHFGTAPDPQALYMVATPVSDNTKGFNQGGYCAYHDYTLTKYYPGVMQHIAFANMPYVEKVGGSCGANLVNSGQAGNYDGVTLASGHEYLEAITDPGAEDHGIGGWYDFNHEENGDKCAYVNNGPGAAENITLATGTYPVQGTWSNEAADGVGYCADARGTGL